MRKGNEPKVIILEEKAIGICLSADYCAEHEWGINELKSSLGIPKQEGSFYRTSNRLRDVGVLRRKNTKYSERMLVLEDRSQDGLVLGYGSAFRSWRDDSTRKDYVPHDLKYRFGKEKLVAAWDESGFFIGCTGTDEEANMIKALMTDLHAAIKNNNVLVFLGGNEILENPGLCIVVADRLPDTIIRQLEDSDKERLALEDEALATGIYEKLKNAKKGFYALSPHRKDDGSIMFWLNPEQQDENNFGWYMVEDLEEWIKGEGRIPKQNQKVGYNV